MAPPCDLPPRPARSVLVPLPLQQVECNTCGREEKPTLDTRDIWRIRTGDVGLEGPRTGPGTGDTFFAFGTVW